MWVVNYIQCLKIVISCQLATFSPGTVVVVGTWRDLFKKAQGPVTPFFQIGSG